jgi:ferric-dicitrate binding protein FerR (iron transport regulator)
MAGRKTNNAAIQWLSWHNEPGHHSEIVLPDSSHVFLGPGGTLRYGRNDDQGRLVQLEGEAYFLVRHDPLQTFTVISGVLSTRDIGTEFDIRYYPGEPSIAIAVASGKVQVVHTPADGSSAAASSSTAAPLAALTTGQLLQYDSLTHQSGITDLSDPSAIGAWRRGILSFRRQRLKEVTGELERYYGIQFQYSAPASGNILITTVLDNKTLADALDILSLTAGVHFTREGHRVLVN